MKTLKYRIFLEDHAYDHTKIYLAGEMEGISLDVLTARLVNLCELFNNSPKAYHCTFTFDIDEV